VNFLFALYDTKFNFLLKSYRGHPVHEYKALAADTQKNIKTMAFQQHFPYLSNEHKIAEKAVCRRVFLTIWQCILSGELTTNVLLQTIFLTIFPTAL